MCTLSKTSPNALSEKLTSQSRLSNHKFSLNLKHRQTKGAIQKLQPAHCMFGFLKRMTQQPYASDYWWNAETVAVVTGGNKGIGNEIAKVLAQQELHVILTARDPKLGTKAAEDIKGHVTFHQLDITDQTSVDSFATWLKNKYGGVTILVNNAGIAYKGDIFGAEEAQTTINTNYLGTRRVCEAMNPLLTQNARIVNVGSRAGVLRIVSPQLQQKIQSVKTVEEVDQLANDFISSIKDDTVQKQGWRKSMYGVSKLLEHAYTQVLSAGLRVAAAVRDSFGQLGVWPL
eukprot:TRINITY_DN6549_c0_g1_i2.p1 TRINITY_DN6549_c0_g1~~TRINITY_DN6549_c0_g1_i2.p1  ORF type:complete len:287 (-),score=45.52 TRINITY_DN6549_c0_g1_i2:16-876(-)